jgi:hypothetical protein
VADAADVVGGGVVLRVDRVELREAVVERLAGALQEVPLTEGGMIVAVTVVVGETELGEALLDAGEVSVPAAVEVTEVGAAEVVEDERGGGGGAAAELLAPVSHVVVVTVMVEVMPTQFLKKSAKRAIKEEGSRAIRHAP